MKTLKESLIYFIFTKVEHNENGFLVICNPYKMIFWEPNPSINVDSFTLIYHIELRHFLFLTVYHCVL